MILVVVLGAALGATAAEVATQVPRLQQPPRIEDFLEMQPGGAAADMARLSGFIQSYPSDGKPATDRTDTYIGYDSAHLYIVFTCFAQKPAGIRSHVGRREDIFNDDYVTVTLDTFHDQRHGFLFAVNPAGVQADGLWTEARGADWSFDTVWQSRAQLTRQGYVVWMAIPFRSVRFRPADGETWGITLTRYLAAKDEEVWWPRVSAKISGRLNQEATVGGLENISPGRSMQFIPYGAFRSFRGLDTRDALQPRFRSRLADMKAGLDSKFVFRDSLVLDATINPDFAQVESDEPQNTVNQRFEVFFPEKRPFFMENANFFEGPLIAMPLQSRFLFTRRIADPEFGARLTGKQGPWNLGFLVADDRSPGKLVPESDPLHGKRAYFAVARMARDIGEQHSLGVLFTDREFQNDFNRVGGLDGLFRLSKNWRTSYRGMVSSTRTGTEYLFGQHHEAVLHGEGLRFEFDLMYLDITPNFRTETGFVPRTDQRSINQYGHFYWRPEGKHLVFHGPEENTVDLWDHRSLLLQEVRSFDYVFGFRRNIVFAPIIAYQSDLLRPQDFSGLTGNRQSAQHVAGVVFRGKPAKLFSWDSRIMYQGTPVVVPAGGQLPYTGKETFMSHTVIVKPTGRLQVDNTYILDHVINGRGGHAVFNNHILRTKWNYQFTREFSLRFISQYNGLLANPQYSSLQTTKNLNFDVLFTYLLHPGTAIYAGYNTNLENLDPGLCLRIAGASECDPSGNGLLRSRSRFINDGRQVFVKVSYLFRP